MDKSEMITLTDVDFPDMKPVTEYTRANAIKESRRYRGGVRISTGRFWTADEFEAYRQRVLDTPLP